MNRFNPSNSIWVAKSRKLIGQWANPLLILGLLLVLIPTLFPYDFFFKEIVSQLNYEYLLSRTARPSDTSDLIANILLFIPFGFGVTCLIQKIKLRANPVLFVVAYSFGLSFIVEFLQIFLPTRNPSYIDLLMNSLGGFVGFCCFRLLGLLALHYVTNLVEKTQRFLSIRTLTIAFIGYFSLVSLLSIKLQGAVELWNLSNWDLTYPLLLGNEFTGDRPWQGQIYALCIADRAASKVEVARIFDEHDTIKSNSEKIKKRSCGMNRGSLVASYLLNEESNQEQPNSVENEEAVSPYIWLQSKASAVVNKKLRQSSQLTLNTTLAAADTNQSGPARIISISQDPFHRNLTLGQWDSHLSLRLRTPLTGQNGTRPELVIPNVFADTKPHYLVVTYNGRLLSVYIDNFQQKYSIELTSEAALFWSLSPAFSSMIHLNSLNTQFYKFLYYGVVFVPLSILLAMISKFLSRRLLFSPTLLIGGIFLPALLLSSILSIEDEGAVNLENLLFSLLIYGGSAFLFNGLLEKVLNTINFHSKMKLRF